MMTIAKAFQSNGSSFFVCVVLHHEFKCHIIWLLNAVSCHMVYTFPPSLDNLLILLLLSSSTFCLRSKKHFSLAFVFCVCIRSFIFYSNQVSHLFSMLPLSLPSEPLAFMPAIKSLHLPFCLIHSSNAFYHSIRSLCMFLNLFVFILNLKLHRPTNRHHIIYLTFTELSFSYALPMAGHLFYIGNDKRV